MNSTKAIEILNQDLCYTYPAKFTDLQDAIALGREALKREVDCRQGLSAREIVLLPGETEEG